MNHISTKFLALYLWLSDVRQFVKRLLTERFKNSNYNENKRFAISIEFGELLDRLRTFYYFNLHLVNKLPYPYYATIIWLKIVYQFFIQRNNIIKISIASFVRFSSRLFQLNLKLSMFLKSYDMWMLETILFLKANITVIFF